MLRVNSIQLSPTPTKTQQFKALLKDTEKMQRNIHPVSPDGDLSRNSFVQDIAFILAVPPEIFCSIF
jgi:hypothetical protein